MPEGLPARYFYCDTCPSSPRPNVIQQVFAQVEYFRVNIHIDDIASDSEALQHLLFAANKGRSLRMCHNLVHAPDMG